MDSTSGPSRSLDPLAKEFVPVENGPHTAKIEKTSNNSESLAAPISTSSSQSKGAIRKQNSRRPNNSWRRSNSENSDPYYRERRYYKESSAYNLKPRNQNRNPPESSQKRHQGNQSTFRYNYNQNQRNQGFRSNPGNSRFPTKTPEKKQRENHVSQRDKLVFEIENDQLECIICCEFIRSHQASWSCKNCWTILHLQCTKKWSLSSKSDDGWRCVACQSVLTEIPSDYFCFCGKTKNPKNSRYDLAHSCGEVCMRTELCPHPCSLKCHPGKCPVDCKAFVTRSCGCGKLSKTFQCHQKDEFFCEEICGKPLNCGVHKCSQQCHLGPCQDCPKTIKNFCFCGKEKKEVNCTEENNGSKFYSCGKICQQLLSCGNHHCSKVCHEDACGICELSPEVVVSCPCGRLKVTSEQRKSCLDPVPTCKAVCGKMLSCGPIAQPHTCLLRCHASKCSPCTKTSTVKCRCGRIEEQVKCRNLLEGKDIRCKKKCTKFRSCGKHKCNMQCCIDLNHVCNLQCNKILNCGRHKCDKKCHIGNCSECPRMSFDELTCRCGAEVIFPPISCGTKPPRCSKPCNREHQCDHPVLHECHSEANCPPCVFLTTKFCYGKHEQRKTIPCNQDSFSCGMPCGKLLACGRHNCIRSCHQNDCEKPNDVCTQKCQTLRADCGHICAAICHAGQCPETPCKEKVEVLCECGNRKALKPCQEFMNEHRKKIAFKLREEMEASQQSGSELKDFSGKISKKDFVILECNEACRQLERNRRLDIAFKVENPNLISYPKFQPNYSEFVRTMYKKDPGFVNGIHEKLTELVKLAKESKQVERSFSFPVMNRDKRHVVHELCEHFGVQSESYDAEPHRNVVARATKETCWLPSMSLQEVVQREQGLRKVPAPTHNAWKKL